MDKLTIHKIEHLGETRIACIFTNSIVCNVVRQIPNRRWSKTRKCWHIPYSSDAWKTLQKLCENKIEICLDNASVANNINENTQVIAPSTSNIIQKVVNDSARKRKSDTLNALNEKIVASYTVMLEIKKYSISTKEVYVPFFRQFVKYFEDTDKCVDDLLYSDIHDYIRLKTSGVGITITKQLISAIKFYYEKMLGRETLYFSLGSNHTIEQNAILFDFGDFNEVVKPQIKKPSHRLCLCLVFFVGLRASDIALLPKDCESELRRFARFPKDEKNAKIISRMLDYQYATH